MSPGDTELSLGAVGSFTPMLKLLLAVGVYLAVILVLGFVLAMTGTRPGFEHDPMDDEL